MIGLDQATWQDVLVHLPNNIYIPSWSGGNSNKGTVAADHMDKCDSGSWRLNIFLTFILVWKILIPTTDTQLGNWRATVSSGNNRDKWQIFVKGSIKWGYSMQVYLSWGLQLGWANLRSESWGFSVVLLLRIDITTKSKLSRNVY